jgi:hypothetical protein
MAATKSSIVPASRKRFTGERKWLRAVRVYIRLANDALTLATAQPFHVLPGDSHAQALCLAIGIRLVVSPQPVRRNSRHLSDVHEAS